MAMTNLTLPPEIEIFRAGRHVDDTGTPREFSDADIDAIAAGYQPGEREAPVVIGHPATDAPAYGWVQKLRAVADAAGRRLTMSLRDVEPAFAEMVLARRFPKRSAAFYPPDHPNNPTPGQWYLRHVGFLGAQPPAVAGLKDIHFADASQTIPSIEFSETFLQPTQKELSVDEDKTKQAEAAALEVKFAESQAQLAAEQAKTAELSARIARFTAQQKATAHAANVAFAEGELSAGRLPPKDKASAIAVLDTLVDAAPVEFAEGDAKRQVSPVEFVKNLISTRAPAVQFGEFAPGHAGAGKPKNDAELDAAAKALAAQKGVSYSEALDHIFHFGV
jgi:hypothetical protein